MMNQIDPSVPCAIDMLFMMNQIDPSVPSAIHLGVLSGAIHLGVLSGAIHLGVLSGAARKWARAPQCSSIARVGHNSRICTTRVRREHARQAVDCRV